MEDKKLTVILPLYNMELYIDRCVRSILNQTYKNIELIIINNGSNDSTESLCLRYKKEDDRVKLISLQNNIGISGARNEGLKNASGEFITFIDGDDWIDNNTYETCIKHFNRDCEIDIVMFSFCREYGKSTVNTVILNDSKTLYKEKEKEKLVRRLVGPIGYELSKPHKMEDLNPIWNKIYKRNIVANIRFRDRDEIGVEDLWFNLHAFDIARSIYFCDAPFYHYNKVNNECETRRYDSLLAERWKKLYLCLNDFYNLKKTNRESYHLALNNRIVINLLPLTRNIINSNLSLSQKRKELRKLCGDKVFHNGFKTFEFRYLPMHWKAFYYACKRSWTSVIVLIMFVAEKIK